MDVSLFFFFSFFPFPPHRPGHSDKEKHAGEVSKYEERKKKKKRGTGEGEPHFTVYTSLETPTTWHFPYIFHFFPFLLLICEG